MFKKAKWSLISLLISAQTISIPTWSHNINWQLSKEMVNNSLHYDTFIKWLDDIPLYLPEANERGLIKVPVTGLTRIQVLDHSSSQSIVSVTKQAIHEFSLAGFKPMFQCRHSDCDQANEWNKDVQDYLYDMTDRQAYLVGYRDPGLGAMHSETGRNRGEYIHIYLNEIGCCVRSIWRYTDLNQNEDSNDQSVVLFNTDSKLLSDSARLILDSIIEDILSNEHRYQVVGHTDSIGTESYNANLAEKRAEAVIQFMVSKGVAVDRLIQVSMGASQPVVNNDSLLNRRLNRRVEVISDP